MATSTSSKKQKHRKTDWPLVEAIFASPLARTVYIWGPPGIGKTYSAYHTGRIDDGVYAITLTEDTPAAELRGHYLPKGSEMVWHDGPLTRAMREGARLVLNEITHGSPEALQFLYPVLESFETARITLPTNETISPAPGFQVIITDNLPPDDLPEALQDRFDCTLEITEPHTDALQLLDDPLRRAAVRSFQLGEDRRVSLRGWYAVQRLETELGLKKSCLAVFGVDRGARIHDAIVLARAKN